MRGHGPPREVTRETLERAGDHANSRHGGDALRSIQNLPGVARPPFISGALIGAQFVAEA